MARILLVIKYTFFVALTLGAGLAVERLMKIKHWKAADSRLQEVLIYNASTPLAHESFDTLLRKHYLKCITSPSKPFCLLAANKRLEIFPNDQGDLQNAEVMVNRLKNITSDLRSLRLRIRSMLADFTGFMKTYGIQVLLIEPSMLFCLLSSDKKYDMLSRGFNPSRLQGSRNVITVGIFAPDSKKLEEANVTKEMLSAGFKIVKFRKWIEDDGAKTFEAVHFFFIRQDTALHAVVFYLRNSYLWHAGLDTQGVDLQGLMFVEDGMFEKFTLLPLNLDGASISQMFLPHDMRYFMREIEASKVVECGTSDAPGPVSSEQPSDLTMDQLNTRAVIALKELKTILAPQMVIFWLWSRSLVGWLQKCDIFYLSTTLELAVTYRSIQDLEFSDLLIDNQFLITPNDTQTNNSFEYQLNCRGLDIKIFILHEEKNTLVFERIREGQEPLKLQYPVFTLCSTHVLGQKIHVPCQADDVTRLDSEKRSTDENSAFPNFSNEMILPFANETGS